MVALELIQLYWKKKKKSKRAGERPERALVALHHWAEPSCFGCAREADVEGVTEGVRLHLRRAG
jgi:hypothetical protein